MLRKFLTFVYRTVAILAIAVVIVSLLTHQPAGALFGGFIAAAAISGIRGQRRR